MKKLTFISCLLLKWLPSNGCKQKATHLQDAKAPIEEPNDPGQQNDAGRKGTTTQPSTLWGGITRTIVVRK